LPVLVFYKNGAAVLWEYCEEGQYEEDFGGNADVSGISFE
jgi:hypothetical protein